MGTRDAAAAVGAADVFVLRRVSGERFVHLGGVGRGEGWAGIVEIALSEEDRFATALQDDRPVVLSHDERELVFGPYYARSAAIVPVPPDTLVVFGLGEPGGIVQSEGTLRAAATRAVEDISPATPAKRLADELEVLEAIRAAVAVSPASVEEAMSELVRIALEGLSCELGALFLADGARLTVVERGYSLAISEAELSAALADVFQRSDFPYCVQDARSNPAPGALASDPGIRSYYLLELSGLAGGVLFVAHTDAAPRGFTLLCRRLGLRVAEVASAVLGMALTREWTAAESARLQSAFTPAD
jgi:hypothetical protein